MIIMQTFYWDCPKSENKENAWWNFVKNKLPELSNAGITTLWLPPSAKSSHIDSMGYAPYDYYDQGEFDQKGGKKTWFGSVQELKLLISAAHSASMTVIADAVLNHCDKGDAEETNPISGMKAFTKFTPLSGKFLRDWTYFHPCEYELTDDGAFYGNTEGYYLPDLCHDNPYTYLELINYIRWLRDRNSGIGYDGFRYDAVKYFDSWIVQSIQEWQKTFGVVEYWDGDKNAIKGYLDYIKWSVSAFDFPLFYTLRDMCNNPNFNMLNLWGNGLVYDIPMNSVTFCENHDTDRSQPIVTDKMMAYAHILTHEGVQCIYWRDYYNYGLALPGTPNGIEKLCQVNKKYAGGSTSLLYTDQNLYIAQRNGWGNQPGLIVLINNSISAWRGTWVQTKWSNKKMICSAWQGRDLSQPMDKWTNGAGWGEFWAPPRGYAVYVPESI